MENTDPTPILLHGPEHSSLQKEAFQRAYKLSDDTPESVLCILRNDRRVAAAWDEWSERYPRLQMRTETLDSFVRDCRERLDGPADSMSNTIDTRLIEVSLSKVTGHDVDTSGLKGEMKDLLGLFENSSLTELDEVTEGLNQAGIDSKTSAFVKEIYREYSSLLDGFDEYTRGEVYDRVSGSEPSFTELYPNVDVVVLSGFYDLQPLQGDVIRWLCSADVPVIATVPLSLENPSEDAGLNKGVRTDLYRSLNFELEPLDTEGSETPASSAVSSMYAARSDPVDPQSQISVQVLPTPEKEVRHIAREVREEISRRDTNPRDTRIGVVVPGIVDYQNLIDDVFESYGVPYTSTEVTSVEDTLVGSAVLDFLSLSRDRPRARRLTSLLTNPLVSTTEELDSQALEIENIRTRTQRSDVDSLLENVEEDTASSLKDIVHRAKEIDDERDLRRSVEKTQEALSSLGITQDRVEDISQTEADALGSVESVLDSLTETVDLYEESPDVIDLLRNAIEDEQVRGYTDSAEPVEVMGLLDARMRSFDSLYVVGMVSEHIPQQNNRTFFIRDIADAVPEVTYVDPRVQSIYVFSTLLANADETTITYPEATLDNEPIQRSPVVDELLRVTTLEPTEIRDERKASLEDLQRAFGPETDRDEYLFGESDLPEETAKKALRGRECASSRATPELTEHDGVVEPETVVDVYGVDERMPYSASRLDTYVSCGYKFYMKNVLGIEAEEDFELGPTPWEAGSYVHDVLRRFYSGLQDGQGERVDVTDYSPTDAEQRLLKIALSELEGMDYEDLFYQRWVEQHLSGLGDPDENPYYADGSPGLFSEFLSKEYQDSNGDHLPAWFEARFDNRTSPDTDDLSGEPVEIDLPSGGSIEVRGIVDRIDMDSEGESAVIVDYKTGNYPNRSKIAEGTKFQLPLYIRASQEALSERKNSSIDSDGQYYQVKPPNTLKRPSGLRDKFNSEEKFRDFLDEVLPRRLGEIHGSIDNGYFNTTLLSARAAGCRYCDFSDICDVRHYMKDETVEKAQQEDVYVPERIVPEDAAENGGGKE